MHPRKKSIYESYDYKAFGQELKAPSPWPFNPWRYASKRLDPETGLFYFGKRYYDPEVARWLTTDPAGFIDSTNLYQYVFNNPYLYYDPDGRFIQFAIPLFAEFAIGAFITKIVVPAIIGGTVAYFGEKTIRALNASSSSREPFARSLRKQLTWNEFVPLQHALKNTNPFDGPVDEDVVIVDENGNAIKIPAGNWATGTKDGKWIQERAPDGTSKGKETGTRKDGGHKPGPQHTDPRSLGPHAHVPEVTNPDGTPWLPIR